MYCDRYAATASRNLSYPAQQHVRAFDRIVLQLYYKLLGDKIVLTPHNVNAGLKRRLCSGRYVGNRTL